jgi:hypothetical protein
MIVTRYSIMDYILINETFLKKKGCLKSVYYTLFSEKKYYSIILFNILIEFFYIFISLFVFISLITLHRLSLMKFDQLNQIKSLMIAQMNS